MLICMLAGYSWTVIAITQPDATVHDVRLAFLFAAIFVMVRLFAKLDDESPMIENLIETRRQLVLGHISADSARKQVDLALHGLSLSDFLSKELSLLLSLMGRFEAELQSARKLLPGYRHLLDRRVTAAEAPKMATENATDEAGDYFEGERDAIATINAALATHLRNAIYIMCNDIHRQRDMLIRKAVGYRKAIGSTENLDWLISELERINKAVNNFNDIALDWFKVTRKYEGEEVAAQNIDQLNSSHSLIKFDRSTGLPCTPNNH